MPDALGIGEVITNMRMENDSLKKMAEDIHCALIQRDNFLVEKGLWQEFDEWLRERKPDLP